MKKKVIVIGATGTIGTAVSSVLAEANYEVVRASRRGPVKVDLDNPSSLNALFASVREVDAVIRTQAEKILNDLDIVKREEFYAETETDARAKLQGAYLAHPEYPVIELWEQKRRVQRLERSMSQTG